MADATDSRSCLLFVDLLGAKGIWTREGSDGAAEAFERFARIIEATLDERGYEAVMGAAVESDSAAVLCESAVAAVRIGVGAYRRAFFAPSVAQERERRTWIRGVIVAADGLEEIDSLRATVQRDDEGLFHVTSLAPVLLDAVSMEKSGFRGMRLLVDAELLSPSDRRALRDEMNCAPLVPVRRLNYSQYPERLDGYEDILWMGSCDDDEISQRRRRMATRMRLAARDAEEIQQAAATQVVFDECAEILESARRRAAAPSAKRTVAKRGTSRNVAKKPRR